MQKNSLIICHKYSIIFSAIRELAKKLYLFLNFNIYSNKKSKKFDQNKNITAKYSFVILLFKVNANDSMLDLRL